MIKSNDLKKNLRSSILIVSDLLSMLFPFIVLIGLSKEYASFLSSSEQYVYLYTHLIITLLAIISFSVYLKHYSTRKSFWYELKEICSTLIGLAFIEVALLKILNIETLWLNILLSWASTIILFTVFRIATKKILSIIKVWQQNVVIIGSDQTAVDVYDTFSNDKNFGFNVENFISISPTKLNNINNIPILNVQPNEIEFNQQTTFIIACENHEIEIANEWLRELICRGYQNIFSVPTLKELPLDQTHISFAFGQHTMLLQIQQSISKPLSTLLKRIFDIVITSLILTMISPILVILYLKVRKDGGPAFYGHERVGQFGKKFDCYKFRSMKTNSKELLEELLAKDENARQEWETHFKLKNDPRVTKIGALLRKTSLDELPQLFNVLRGDMSLVGPRPITEIELQRYEKDVSYYYLAKPGITGLWQVSGRSEIDYVTRVKYDTWYVKNWSLWNDFVILLKTVKVVLARDGAY
ncbi:undecaprenyl-phosphate galactose phosphotransferase WbaP [Acinetobacter rathckeae]|uniref:undecaprenyl-phosphate galactose phosphotransferase WbaP n=1 Tax=Acinetobacter rathckeae TaxID=2605272 RepID=UPI0018A255BE|nr:undecaprenyl-phosphate galactose phosphotransferase WbaP [Acinetobacter rathckeae]MBF7688985.1 undecaprenyl-phosphate galactose phosphotransferase WbaP [Acinetobacter rathckeae]